MEQTKKELKIVRGNDFYLNVPVREISYVKDATGKRVRVTDKIDLDDIMALMVTLVSSDGVFRKTIPFAVSRMDSSTLVVKVCSGILLEGWYGLEIIGINKGNKIRSYERKVFKIVGSNGQGEISPDVYEGEASYQIDTMYCIATSVIIIDGGGDIDAVELKDLSVNDTIKNHASICEFTFYGEATAKIPVRYNNESCVLVCCFSTGTRKAYLFTGRSVAYIWEGNNIPAWVTPYMPDENASMLQEVYNSLEIHAESDLRFAGIDQTKSSVTEALEATAQNPGVLYLNADGTIVINGNIYSKIIGAYVNGQQAQFDPDHPGMLVVNVPTNFVPLSQKGVANGVATLASDGKVPASQLPSYVDDIVDTDEVIVFDDIREPGGIVYFKPDTPEEIVITGRDADTSYRAQGVEGKLYIALALYSSSSTDRTLLRSKENYRFEPAIADAEHPDKPFAEDGKIYVNTYNNLTYRCSNTSTAKVVEISQSLALGETATTAFRGDRGKEVYDVAVTNLKTQVRNSESASDTAIASEKAVRGAVDAKITDYNHLDSNLQGDVDNSRGHVNDAPSLTPVSRGLYKIGVTEHGHVRADSGNTPTPVVKNDLTNLGVEDSENKTDIIRASEYADSIKYPSELAVRNEINNLDNKIAALSAGVKVSLSISPSVIYKGESRNITLTGTMTNGTPTSMKIMDGSTELKTSTSSPISHTVSITPTANSKSYGLQGVTLGMTLTASASVNARYPIYYGFGADVASVAISANRYPATTSALNTYTKTAAANGYFYILVPSDIAGPSKFTMGGAPFVMTSSTQTIGSVSYTVYQSGNMYNSGTSLTVVAQ